MAQAIWKGKVIAETDTSKCVELEGNIYFPPNAVKKKFFKKTNAHSICPWKGEANYYDIIVDGRVNKGAAWYYPKPNKEAKHLKNYVAFWRGVEIKT